MATVLQHKTSNSNYNKITRLITRPTAYQEYFLTS